MIGNVIRKELENIGIIVTALDANKDIIFGWFSNAVETGAFQEVEPPSPLVSTCSSDIHSPITCSSSPKVGESESATVSVGTLPLIYVKYERDVVEPPVNRPNAAASDATRQTTRIAILFAALSWPRKRLSAAVDKNDVVGVKQILNDPASRRAIDDSTLYTVLKSAIEMKLQDLIKAMIGAGAPIKPTDAKARYMSPFMVAAKHQDQSAIRYLLGNSADVNYQAKYAGSNCNALICALERNSERMVSLLF